MSRFVWLLLLALASPVPSAGDRNLDAAATITAREAAAHVTFLADDLLEGREAATRGGRLAGAYLASQLADTGLEPAGEGGSWFQSFPVPARRLAAASLGGTRGGVKRTFRLGIHPEGILPLLASASGDASGAVVFAGFGLSSPELDYDDYAAIDVKGKVVLIFHHAPRYETPDSPFARGESRRTPDLDTKLREAAERGAVALLVMNDLRGNTSLVPSLEASPWPSLQRGREEDAVLGTIRASSIPAVQIGSDLAAWLLETDREGIRGIQKEIEDAFQPHSRAIGGLKVSIHVTIAEETREARNVLGWIRGADPVRREEIVVVGAHFDHLGRRPGGVVFHGADDNASGTAAMLEIAEAFAALDPPPARSILVAGFSGEEKGLLGSRNFLDNPPFPASMRIAAMIDCDMIGRNQPEGVFLSGAASSPALHAAALEAAAHVGLPIAGASRPFLTSSDAGPFYAQRIPVCFFFTGLHEDYHQPSDTSNRTDPHRIARVAQTAFLTALAVADLGDDLHFVELPKAAYLGVDCRPGDPTGLPVSTVRSGSPGATAGVRVGDRIVRVGDRDLASLSNPSGVQGEVSSPAWVLREAVETSAPGDVLRLGIVREGQPQDVDVVLGESP